MTEAQQFNRRETALILIDFINDIVTDGGKLAGKGYSTYVQSHRTSDKVRQLIAGTRAANFFLAHVRVGFSGGYVDHPANSPLFGAAKRFGALAIGGWGTEFAEFAQPKELELLVTKHRVSAFFGTSLELALRSNRIEHVLIAGCATDLAVQSAARDAHDRDFSVTVVEDACAAASDSDHNSSLTTLAKIARITTVADLLQTK